MAKTKDYLSASINTAFAGVATKALDDSSLDPNMKSLGRVTIGAALIKDTGKKLKIL